MVHGGGDVNTLVAVSLVMRFGLAVIICLAALVIGVIVISFIKLESKFIQEKHS
jgi:hypothetical protein